MVVVELSKTQINDLNLVTYCRPSVRLLDYVQTIDIVIPTSIHD